jgi:hypothetical protein
MCQHIIMIVHVARAVGFVQNQVSIIIKNRTITIGFCKKVCKNLIIIRNTRRTIGFLQKSLHLFGLETKI